MIDRNANVSFDANARSVFAGLVPQPTAPPAARLANPTLPILLVGAMTVSMHATAHQQSTDTRPAHKPTTTDTFAAVTRVATATVLPAPSTYTVVAGDTVSKIAARYGLSTATVLKLNGLSTSSLIFPGQKLKLTTTAPTAVTPPAIAGSPSTSKYTIVKGDTIGAIAKRFKIATQSVLAANGLGWSSIIFPGQVISIPGHSAAPATPPAAVPPPVVAPPVAEVPVVTTPAAPPAPVPVVGYYVIQSGDSMSKIAAKFGVSLQSILDANGLTRTSIIYTGRTVTIPGVSTAVTTPASAGTVVLLTEEQEVNAATIIGVGRSLGVSDYGLVIALATAMQESSLRNLNYGHLDSVGLFQQRPSAGWGTVAQITDPNHSARLFFGGPSNPNKGKTRGLLDISGWQSMTVTQAAQKVQVSAYPNAYAKWETSARFWLSELG